MKDQKSIISINSLMLYVIAFLLTTIFHELGHAIAGSYYDTKAVLHHNYVEQITDHLSISQRIITVLAGPLISLIQGILAGFIFLKLKKHSLLSLLLLWLAILGLNNFFGYLLTGPVFSNGDIGKVYLLLDFPLWSKIMIAILAAAIITFIAYKLTKPFLGFSFKEEWLNSEKNRTNFNFHIIILPWLLGSVILTILYLPIIAIVSIIYPIMSGMIFIFPWKNARAQEDISVSKNERIGKLSILSLLILCILVVLFRFVLAPGVKFY